MRYSISKLDFVTYKFQTSNLSVKIKKNLWGKFFAETPVSEFVFSEIINYSLKNHFKQNSFTVVFIIFTQKVAEHRYQLINFSDANFSCRFKIGLISFYWQRLSNFPFKGIKRFFYKQHFYKQRQANAKQQPKAKLLLLENYSYFSSTLSSKINRKYSKK